MTFKVERGVSPKELREMLQEIIREELGEHHDGVGMRLSAIEEHLMDLLGEIDEGDEVDDEFKIEQPKDILFVEEPDDDNFDAELARKVLRDMTLERLAELKADK